MSDDTTLNEFVSASDSNRNQTWRRKQLQELVEQLQAGGTPDTDKSKYYDGDIPWIKTGELGQLKINSTEQTITERGLEESTARLFPSKTVLIAMYGATTGEVSMLNVEAATNQACCGIIPRDSLNPYYLYYQLVDGKMKLESLSAGSGQQNISKSILKKYQIPVAPLPEQRKIATVLHTVDQAIQKTSEVIERIEAVRRGTEQTLLSRGILEDGTLRDEEQTEHKNSWVEEVPKSWSVKQYNELIADSSVGIVVKPSQYYDDTGEVPILRSKDISRDGIVSGDFEYMTQESNKENSNSRLESDDVITVRSGEPGLSCVVSKEFDGANCADLLISTPGESLDPRYTAMWINSRAGRKQIDRFQAGLAQKHFNLGALRKMRFAVPEIEEQRRIVEKVGAVTESLDREKKYKSQLRRLKRGLMQDLLSGTVRTADAGIEIPDEITQHG